MQIPSHEEGKEEGEGAVERKRKRRKICGKDKPRGKEGKNGEEEGEVRMEEPEVKGRRDAGVGC